MAANSVSVFLPFKADYAKSSRASCKLCSSTITKDDLRLASVTISTRFDGQMVRWFHYSCFFEKNRPKSYLEIESFDELRWEDQEKIKKKLGSVGSFGPTSKISDFSVEYASTGRASCKVCENGLSKGELRISGMGHDERYGTVKKWYHPKCFKEHLEEFGFCHDVKNVSGFSSLDSSDQSMLSEVIGKVKKARKKPDTVSNENEQKPAKKAKTGKSELNNLSAQNKRLWKLIDKLKTVERKEVKTFVEVNVTEMPRGESDLFQCAADLLLFGAIEACPECGSQIFAKSDAYHCSGQISAYTSCLYTSKDIKRRAFKIPKDLVDEDSVFLKFSYVPSVRIFPEVAAVASKSVFDNNTQSNMSQKELEKRDNKWKSELKSMKVVVKGGAVVDPESGLSDSHHVLICNDTEPKQPYSSILNYVDIARGINSYYRLQILESDENKGLKKQYHVFRAWGRLGTTIGDTKLEKFYSKDSAIANFEEVYFDKTGNLWVERKRFVKKAGKFAPVEVEYSENAAEMKNIKQDFDSGESKLPLQVQELIRMIANFENLKKDMAEYEIDMEKMPLGKLSRNQINEGYKLLTEASLLLSDAACGQDSSWKMKVLDVSNKFFSVIPHDFGMRRAPLLDSHDIINEKCRMLDNLAEIETAFKLFSNVSASGQAEDGQSQSMLDSYYGKLKCIIEPLGTETEEYKNIKTYVTNTHAPTHSHYTLNILDIFELNRKIENMTFKPFESWTERKLLWHGSRTSNFGSILSKGLKIAPPEAPVTGYMFGKGVYFADMVSKSANYCQTSPENNVGLLLLCEVALGKPHCLTAADSDIKKPPFSTYSLFGMGKSCPDPEGFIKTQSGCVIPCGAPIESEIKKSDLLYNEFIVYDTAQIKLKYLVKVEFNYSIADLI